MSEQGLQLRRFAELTPENLRRLIEDMGQGPGWYTSADLYRWYAGMCVEDGAEPVSHKAFGMALAALGYSASTRRVCGKPTRGWSISRRAERGQTSPEVTS